MSLELLNRRDDDVAWLALARSSNVSEQVARVLWARAQAEAGHDPIKAERTFKKLLDDSKAVDALARELEAHGDGGLLDPGKWTRVLDLSGTSNASPSRDEAGASAATRLAKALEHAVLAGETAAKTTAASESSTLTEALRTFARGDVGRVIASIDNGSLQHLIRVFDALVTIVEHEKAARAGKPLPTNIRSELEDKLGIDFGDVRVHDDSQAAAEANQHDAVAFARGKDVYFANGAYDPSSAEGKKLIAHEVTHVAQQRGGGRAAAGAMSEPGSAVEREADRVANAFGAGAARGAAALQVRERAAVGTISRSTPGADADAAGGAGVQKWKPNLFGSALDLAENLKLAKDIGGGHKEIKIDQNIGPLRISKARFKPNEAGDKVDSGTLHASIDAGMFKGTEAQLKVDVNEGVSGKVNVPINAPGMFAKEVELEVGAGSLKATVRLNANDVKNPHFPIKHSDLQLTVESNADDLSGSLIGTAEVEIKNGLASGNAVLNIDLHVSKKDGVTFNAHVAGKIAIAGLAEADTSIFWDGKDLKFEAGGTSPIKIPGLEGIANFKYELGKLSVNSDNVRFTWPTLSGVNFRNVELGNHSKLKANLELESPVVIPIPKAGGASVTLEHSSIAIDGKHVEGELTGSFALNNEGGFKGKVHVGYTKEGGFKGAVGIEGGVSFKVAGVQVTIDKGTKLDVEKNEEGVAVSGEVQARAKIPGIPAINVQLIAKPGEPIDLSVDTTVQLKDITPQLKGDVHVKYQRATENTFSFDGTNIGVMAEPLHGQVIFSQLSAQLKGKEITGALTAASGTEIKVGKTTKVTILGGRIELLPGKKLDGHLQARGESGGGGETGGGSEAQATIGWTDGKFDWAAEGNFELKDITNGILEGSVHAAAGSNGTGNFVSNGPINFGNKSLKNITIEHLSGNKEEGNYEATISAHKAINKVLEKVPNVKIVTADAAVKVAYKDKKLSFNGLIGGSVAYPATGEEQLSGKFLLGVDENTGDFIGEIDEVHVKSGDYFESKGGHVDLTSGEVTLGTATFNVPHVCSGEVKHAEINIKHKLFSVDLDVDMKVKQLEGVKLTAHVDNEGVTAAIREDTPPIELGKFATLQITNNSNVSFIKDQGGIQANLVGRVVAKEYGEGEFNLNYSHKKLTGSSELHIHPFAMFDKIDVHLNFDENRKVSTTQPILIGLSEQYEKHFIANAEINVDKNVFNVKGAVTELKDMGSVGDAFKKGGGASIEYDQATQRVTMDAGFALDAVVKELGEGSTLRMHYGDKVVTIDGVLRPKSYGPVHFSETSQINASWNSKDKHFTVVGGAQASIAELCDVDFNVDASLGGGQPGQFGLRGHIDALKLAAKLPGVSFSAVTADFSVLIGGGAQADLDFSLHAGINGIPAANITEVDGYLDATYKTGQGINGWFGVNNAKIGPVIADGRISVERGKFKEGSLHFLADFPKLRIEGTGVVSASEMGGLNTSADLEVKPAPETAIGKFIQTGSIHVDLEKWKVTNALGKLNLVPPSFLPLINPVIEVGYKPEEGVHACLKTQFPAPMAKNGELGNFEVGYKQGDGLYAHVDFPIQVPGFQTAIVTGDLDKRGVRIGVDLFPKNASLVKQARVEVGYSKEDGFYVLGKIRLKPTEHMELEVGLKFDGHGLQVIGMEPDDKDATNEDHELAKWDKKFPTIPLLTVGVAQLGLKFGMGIHAGYRMPKIKFKNPQLEGGLEALDSGGMPAFTFGGSIAMGAYVALSLNVQVVGEIQLLIVTASAGIGAEITARLDLELGADVNGRYAPGRGAEITIDPYVSASLSLIASLIATLYAEIGWWTILDKKWTLAEKEFARIELGKFQPFHPVGLAFGGPGGTRLINGMSLREDAFDQIKSGVEDGGRKSADSESNRETREKLTPVLQSFKNAAPQFQELPPGWEKGMVAVPVDFSTMFPVDDDKWDVYQDHADQAEDMVPELRMNTPTERLAKAVAVTARKNPYAAGRLILGWRRAQIAAKGINPDTGLDVVNERLIVQAIIDEKYEKDLADAAEKQRIQDEEHAAHVQKQGVDFTKAQTVHTQVGVQQQIAHEQNVSKIQTEWNKAQDKKAQAGKAAANEGAEVKPVAQEKAPPPPKPAAPPKPPALAKPAPIPVPPKVPLPPPKEVLPAVTLPALPDDPGVSVKAAGVIPPQQKKAEVKSPAAKDPPKGNVPDPKPGATNAAKSVGGGGSPMPTSGESSSGQGPNVSGTTSSVPPPGPKVAAGPDGIISQNKTIDGKHSKYDPSFKGGGGAGKPGILGGLFGGGGDKPAPAGGPGAAKDGKGGPPGAPGGDAAKKDGAPGGKPAANAVDPTVQKVVDQGKAEEHKQKQVLDSQKKTYDSKVQQNNKQAEADVKKLDAAGADAKKKKEQEKAAAAEAAAHKDDAAKKSADGKPDDKKPKGPIGVRVTIDILGEPHTLYIDETTGAPMVEPPPTPVATKLAELKTAIGAAPSAIKSNASGTETAAESIEKQLEEITKKLLAGDESAKAEVAGKEQALANSLKVTWAWAKVAADPAVTGGSIEKPLLHPYYPEFKSRVAQLSQLGHISGVDAGPFAEAIWTKICEAVKKATPQMNDPQAYSDFAKGWLNMQSPQFKQAISELEHIGKELAKAASTAFTNASSFGFWSKEEGRTLAQNISGITLETSAIGTLMDGLPTLDGKKAGWDPEIWGALSNAYATAVVPEVIKGKKINVCIGAGVPAGNIWDAVESVALQHGLKQVGIELDHVTTHFGAAAKSKKNRAELDETKVFAGIKGCVFKGDRAGAIAAADAHFKTIPDEVAPAQKPATPAAPAPGAQPAGAEPELMKTAAEPVVATTTMDGAPHTLKADPESGKVEFNSIKGYAAEKLQAVVKLVPDDVRKTVTDALAIAVDVAAIVVEPPLKPGAKPGDRPPVRQRLATRLDNLASAIRVFGDTGKFTDADPAVIGKAKADADAKAKADTEAKAKAEADAKAKADAETKAKEAEEKAKQDAKAKQPDPAPQPNAPQPNAPQPNAPQPNAAQPASPPQTAAPKLPDPALKPPAPPAQSAQPPAKVDPNAPVDPKAASQQPPAQQPHPADPAAITAMSASYKEIGGPQVALKIDPASGTVTANGADVAAHSDSRPAKEISDGIKAAVTKYLADGTKDEERKELLTKIKTDLEALRKAMAYARGEESPVVQMRVVFEKNIGAKAYAEAPGFAGAGAAVDKMVTSALKIIADEYKLTLPEAAGADAIVKQMATDPAIVELFDKELGYPKENGYAGAVGMSFDAITKALVSGSLTQKAQHLIKFGEDYLGKQLLYEAPTVMAAVKKSLTDAQKKALDEKIAAGAGKRGTKAQGKAAKSLMTDPAFQKKVDKDGPMDDKTPAVPVEALDRGALFRLAKQAKVEVENHDTDAEIIAKLQAKGIKDSNAWMTTTPEEGPDKPELTKDGMPYLQGIEANLVIRQHPWITDARVAEMPLKAGISGTTHRFLGLGSLLGLNDVKDKQGMRLAMLGHLQAIEAHSFWEICDAVGTEPERGKYVPFHPVPNEKMEEAAKETIAKDPAAADKLGPQDVTAQVGRLLGTVASDKKG